jgi:ABC-type branched-subunit amino acid transport system ATPase component
VLVFGILSALVLRSASRFASADLDRTVAELVEEEELDSMATRGVRLPMLACRGVDFSYGRLQVLFGVDFTVDDGEMVALLGTNGAGKSTLLGVISGLGLPSRGSVRFRGGDITFLDAERRVGLGITQVPGGRAVFGPMTVVENLRAFGYAHGRERRRIDAAIDESLAAFPRLADHRSQAAQTLSGGEQQMLGLAKALILRPRLLLVDELSLGLAPKVVAELLEMVRRINASGTAVVLVEQSVNIALSLVDHAYFMERGEVRFDGRAADLLARTDLLRSVFLEGATKGMRGGGSAVDPVPG